jgi:hypothetical protein
MNVIVDDGNLPCLLTFASLDLLTQMNALNKLGQNGIPANILRQNLFFTTMIF